MNIRRRNKHTSEVYSSSLSDIMFFLLLFFLITSTMATPNVLKLLVPNAKSGKPAVKHPVTISVSSDLQYAVNNKIIPFEAMENELKANLTGQEDPTAILKVDKTVQAQNMVDILDIANRLKIKIVLATNLNKQK